MFSFANKIDAFDATVFYGYAYCIYGVRILVRIFYENGVEDHQVLPALGVRSMTKRTDEAYTTRRR